MKFIIANGKGFRIDWQALYEFHRKAATDPSRSPIARLWHLKQAREVRARHLLTSRTRKAAVEPPWTWERCLEEARQEAQPLLLEKKAVMSHFPHSAEAGQNG